MASFCLGGVEAPSPAQIAARRRSHCRIFATIGFTLYLSLAHELMAADSQVTHIAPAELAALIDAGQSPVVIDVRSGWEYRTGHIPGAIHIPFWLSFTRTDEIKTPKQEPIVVYCAHGPRAGVGKYALERAGFTRVIYLEGHMTGWRKAGLPVEQAPD